MSGTSWLKILERVAQQDQPAPVDESDQRVVALRGSLDKLYRSIKTVNSELVQAQTENHQIGMAWDRLQLEHRDLLKKNETQQRDIIQRLVALQVQMVDAVNECGIRAEVVETKMTGG